MADELIRKSLAPSSRNTYDRAFEYYSKFIHDRFGNIPIFPATVEQLVLFIAHSFEHNLAASTVTTYVSAISYFLKMRNVPDPTSNFIVKKCLQGYQKCAGTSDTRLPITPIVLRSIVGSLDLTTNSHFIRLMLKSMYLLAFHAFLRVGEFTVNGKSTQMASSVVCVHDVHFIHEAAANHVAFELKLSGYKHSKGKCQTLYIERNVKETNMCPVHALWSYLQLRGETMGPIFSFMDGSPVSRSYFTQQLKLSLIWAGYDTQFYKGHGFRIGAASC